MSRKLAFPHAGRLSLFHAGRPSICVIARIVICAGLMAFFHGGPAKAAETKSKVVDIKILKLDADDAAKISYTRDVKPILVNNCLECHSAEDKKGDLDASTIAGLLKPGKKAGPAVVPGRPDDSAMVQYIRGQREPQMPKGNPELSEQELHVIRLWIYAGAKDDSDHPPPAIAKASSPPPGSAALSLSGGDPAVQEAMNTLMFSDNNEKRLIAQRTIRLAWLPAPPVPPRGNPTVFNEIDQFIVAKWEQAGLDEAKRPPKTCDDTTFLRRAYLDVIGVLPTVNEARDFLQDPLKDKRSRLIDKLLARNEDYAAHWTPFWEEALGSANVDKQGGIATRGNYRNWIYTSFIENKPFDVMVAELIDPTMPGYQKPIISEANGKRVLSGYILNESHNDTVQTAANTAQVFLGTGMKCASCHSHFLNKEWPQARFMAFAGMFAGEDMELIRCEKKSGQMIPAAFPFDLPGVTGEMPRDVDHRLHRLAQMLVDPTNPRFARTIVNRLWKRYLGVGLFMPIDDFRLDQPPSHPELLEWLANDFMRHGYDLKHTIRLILNSRTYQLRYDPALEDHFDVAKPTEPRYFRSPGLRRLTAEELVDSIQVATSQKLDPKRRLYLRNASTALTRALGKPASRNEISTSRPEDVAVVQALELLNGEEFHELVYSGNLLAEAARTADPARSIDLLYWSALDRPASEKERDLTSALLTASTKGVARSDSVPTEFVWVDDAAPSGSTASGTGGENAWKWVERPKSPVFSGAKAHAQGSGKGQSQHYFLGANPPLQVNPSDLFFTYVYLDPKDPPKEIMLQWNDGQWEHRAYWGADSIPFGAANTASRRPMGALPKTGEWIRLEVPADKVGILSTTEIAGWSFDQSGGQVYWDKAGVVRRQNDPRKEPLGDVLWALFSSPEFQYIR